MTPQQAPALIAVSHGTSDPQGRGAICRLVEAVREHLGDVDVRQAFVDVEEPSLPEVLGSVHGPVTVVPLLLGAGFHVHVDIATAVATRHSPGTTIVTGTLGPDPAIVGLLLDRIRAVGLAPADEVVLATAGSTDVRARLAADRVAALVAARLARRVRVGHLGGSGRPLNEVLAEARHESDGGRVVAASYLLAPGHFARMLDASAADVVTAPLSSGVQLDQRLVDVVLRRYRAVSANAHRLPA